MHGSEFFYIKKRKLCITICVDGGEVTRRHDAHIRRTGRRDVYGLQSLILTFHFLLNIFIKYCENIIL